MLIERHKIKFCSLSCQMDYRHQLWIKDWKNGRVNGTVGITTRCVSGHLKRYLLEKFGNRCSECGWNKRNPVTGAVPLEIDHIDGNSENSSEENLRVLCPNCHALTPFYKNLNKGYGRQWRTKKYIKNTQEVEVS